MLVLNDTRILGKSIIQHIFKTENGLMLLVTVGGKLASYVQLNTNDPLRPDYGSSKGKYEVHSSTMDLYLQVYTTNFDGYLTIAVYLKK